MKAGRPKITTKDLILNWQQVILELAKQGASDVELSIALDISRDTFYKLQKRESIFFDTIKKAHDLCEGWWLEQGRTNLWNKDFSPVLFYMNMKNRFGWKDKQELTGENGGAIIMKWQK